MRVNKVEITTGFMNKEKRRLIMPKHNTYYMVAWHTFKVSKKLCLSITFLG